MKKEDILTLWKAKEWDCSSAGVYFTGQFAGGELYLNFTGFQEEELCALDEAFLKRLATDLASLNQQAHDIIQKEFPGEDTSELFLTDIMFEKCGYYDAFALGYDAGDSPAGRLYFLVKFNAEFQPDPQVIYETY